MRRAAQGRRPVRVRPRRRRGGCPARCGCAVRSGPGHHVCHRGPRLRGHPADAAPLVDVVHGGHRTRGPVGRRSKARSIGMRSGVSAARSSCSWGSPASARSPSGCWRAAGHRTRRSRPSPGARVPSNERSGRRWRRSRTSRSQPPATIVIGEVAALDLGVVRDAAAVRPAGRRDPGARAGVGVERTARGARRGGHRVAGDRDRRSGRRRRCASTGRGRHRQLRLAGRHFGERRPSRPCCAARRPRPRRREGGGNRPRNRRGLAAGKHPRRPRSRPLRRRGAARRVPGRAHGPQGPGPPGAGGRRARCAAGRAAGARLGRRRRGCIQDRRRGAISRTAPRRRDCRRDHLHFVIDRRALSWSWRDRTASRRPSPASARSLPRPRALVGCRSTSRRRCTRSPVSSTPSSRHFGDE